MNKFFIIIFLLSIDLAHELNLGWDAKYFYYIKALFFIENQNFGDLNKFADNLFHQNKHYWVLQFQTIVLLLFQPHQNDLL